jgi:hypothetical protein
MKKQTAVDYLIEQLIPKALSAEQYYHIEKAKAMEKEQMVHCYEQAYREGYIDNGKSGDQYYNETYKGGEQ